MLQLDFGCERKYSSGMGKKRKAAKKLASPYVSIDWDKAGTLFRNSSLSSKQTKTYTAAQLLCSLANAADKGFTFLTHAADPAIVEYMHFGTGPLRWPAQRTVSRFQKQKYVSVTKGNKDQVIVKITKHGMERALSYQLNTMKLTKQTHWDKKWRVVMFDIPDTYRRLRDIFRMRLRQLGLYKLQESVYVSPYSCFDEIEFLRELYGISFTVQYLLVQTIEHDEDIRQHFNL